MIITFDSKIEFVDFNNNNVFDILFLNQNVFELFVNDGLGVFTNNSSSITEIQNILDNINYDFSVADYNYNGNNDIIINYGIIAPNGSNINYYLKLFKMDGNGNFIFDKDMKPPLYSFNEFSLYNLDANNDGFIDAIQAYNGFSVNEFNQFFISNQCSTTYNTISEFACSEYISPSGKIITQSGVYIDTVYNVKWCDSIITIDLTINEVDVSVSVLPDNSLKANQDNATYLWGSNCSLQFSPIVMQTNQTFMPLTNASYGVIVTYNGCADTSECINYFLGTNKNNLSLVKAFPNPTYNNITIKGLKNSDYAVAVYDIYGKEIFRSVNPISKIDLTNFTKGIYYVKVYNDIYSKLIKVEKL